MKPVKLKISSKSLMKLSLLFLVISLIVFIVFHLIFIKAESNFSIIVYDPVVKGDTWSKKVLVLYNGSEHLYDISVSTVIPEDLKDLELYRYLNQEMMIRVSDDPAYDFKVLDTDNNGSNDTVSWIVPELSEVLFKVEGVIPKEEEIETITTLIETFVSEVGISFDRDLDCPRCGKHKAPPLTDVNMTISATVSTPVENANLTDYYPNDWTVVNANGGSVSQYNSSYKKIEWSFGTVTDSVSRWYILKSPERTSPPTKYYFQSELDGQKSDWWMVIVSDPSNPMILELWVDANTSDFTAWTAAGTEPYLDAIDGTNKIWESADDSHYQGNFSFTDESSDLGVINSVEICVYGMTDAGDDGEIEIFLTNSTGEYSAGQYALNVGSYDWINVTNTSVFPTWSEINSSQVRFRAERVGGVDIIHIDAALLKVNYTEPDPTYSNIETNNSEPKPNEWVLHSVKWSTDAGSLSGYIFSNNYSGSWSNKTWTSFSGSWSNETNRSTTLGVYGWRVYANNSFNQWGDTGIRTLIFSNRWLEVNWTSGSQVNSTDCTASQPCEFSQYSTFNASANVTCKSDVAGVSCGSVSGSIRYNSSGASPDELINTTEGAMPFYVTIGVVVASWNGTTLLSPTPNRSTDPTITSDNSGNIWVAWHDYDINYGGPDRDILYDFYNASTGTWNGTTLLSPTSDGSYTPTITSDNSGNIWVAWRDFDSNYVATDTDILYDFYNASTGTWNGTISLSQTPDHSVYPTITSDNSGNIWVAWQDWDNGYGGNDHDIVYDFYNVSTGTWKGTTLLSQTTNDSYSPTITSDNSGNIWVAWYDYNAPPWTDIYYDFYNVSTGTWNGTTVLSTPSAYSSYPTITKDNSGNIWVAWWDSDASFGGSDYDIVYDFYNPSTGTWNGTTLLSQTSDHSSDPTITADNSGNIWVAWEDVDTNYGGSDRDILYDFYNPSTGTWNGTTLLSQTSGGSYTPTITSDNSGNIWVAWYDYDASFGGSDYDILYDFLPFSQNPISCGSLSDGSSCQLNWTINASGTPPQLRVIDVNFSSSLSTVTENDTDDAYVNITGVPAGDTTPPQWSNNDTQIPTPVEYRPDRSYGFSVDWSDSNTDVSVGLFEWDGTNNYTMSNSTSTYWYNMTDLAVGTYQWKSYANNTDDYWNETDTWSYQVTQNTSASINLFLNDTQGQFNMSQYEYLNTTAVLLGVDNYTIEIWTNYSDGTWKLWASGFTVLQNITQLTQTGIFNFTANFTNANYTSAFESWLVNVTVGIPPYCDALITDDDLPYTIGQNNTYYCVVEDLSTTGNTNAITFQNITQNSTLDCLNYNLDGDDTYPSRGIFLNGTNNINNTIKNCNITDYYYGIQLLDSDSNIMTNITAISNSRDILLQYSHYNNITNKTGYQGIGVYLSYSNSTTITNMTAISQSYGLFLSSSDSTTITNITAISSLVNGLRLSLSDLTTIKDSTIKDSSSMDVYFTTTSDWNQEFINVIGTDDKPIVYYNSSVTIENWDNNVSEIILGNADYSVLKNITLNRTGTQNNGIFLVETDLSNLTDINVINLQYGIYLGYGSNANKMQNITAISNYNGLYISSSFSNTLINITAISNYNGLYLFSSADSNRINNSKIQDSSNYGIYLSSSGSSANLIYNNLFNNTNNFRFSGSIYSNNWNTTRQIGDRIYSNGVEIGGNYWTNSTGNDYSDTCDDDEKDGFCDDPYIIDPGQTGNNTDYLPLSNKYEAKPPTFSNNATNTTVAGQPANFTIDVTDNVFLYSSAGYIFSTNNSGTWVNSSWIAFTDSAPTQKAWNVTVLNDTIGALVQWMFYANDTSNDWNASEIYNLTTTPLLDTSPPQWSNNDTQIPTPVEYRPDRSYGFSVDWSDSNSDVSVGLFEWDGTNNYTMSNSTSTYWYNMTDLAVGTYQWKSYANNTDDYWNETDTWTYQVTQNTSASINLFLNDTQGQFNMTQYEYLNTTAVLSGVDNYTIEIWTNYSDGTWKLWDSGFTVLQNITQLNTSGVFNFTANFTNANYTSAFESWLVNVSITCSLSIQLSDALVTHITWGELNPANSENVTNASAMNNSDTTPFTEQGNTQYNLSVSVSGCSPNTADVYMAVEDHLKCSSPTCGSTFIGVSNITYDNKTTDGEGYPTCVGPCLNYSKTYSDTPDTWLMVGPNLADGTILYFRYWICPFNTTGLCNADDNLYAGIYNTTFKFKGVVSGNPP